MPTYQSRRLSKVFCASPQKEKVFPNNKQAPRSTVSMDRNQSSEQGRVADGAVRSSAQNSEPGSLVHPTENDIILGRGVLHAGHPGNIRFYATIDDHIPAYNAALTRKDKTQVVQTIYDILTLLARFVKEDAPSAACLVIDEKESKKKISHAIRYRRQPDKATGRRTRSQSPPSRTRTPRQQPQQSPQQLQQQQRAQLREEQPTVQQVQQMQRQLVDRSAIQPIHLPALPQPIQQLQDGLPQIHAGIDAPSAPLQQGGQQGGGSPQSLFSDGELESVLLPPEVMASARMPYEDFLGEDYGEGGGSPGDHER